MKPVPHFSVANIRISEQTTKFYLSFLREKCHTGGTEPDLFCIMRSLRKRSGRSTYGRLLPEGRKIAERSTALDMTNGERNARNEHPLRELPLSMRCLHKCSEKLPNAPKKDLSFPRRLVVDTRPLAGAGGLVALEDIAGVDLGLYVIQSLVVAIGDDSITLLLKLIQVIHNL